MKKNLMSNQYGFASILEVIVTSLVFVTAAMSIFTTISMLRPQGVDSIQRLEAAYVGKSIIDDLRTSVDARVWDAPGGDLEVGTHPDIVIGDYRVVYTISTVPGLADLRKLDMDVFYEP